MPTSDESIDELCHDIVVKSDRNEELRFLIDHLSRACNGDRGEVQNSLFKVLNSEDILLSILKVNKCTEALKTEVASCVEILNGFLYLSCLKNWRIIIFLLKVILESDFKVKNSLVQDIWCKQELCRMPAEVVLTIVKYKPALIENQWCNLYFMARKNENIWQKDYFHCWVCWCSKSKELFLIVSSVLNQFLIYMNANLVILKIVNKFICKIMSECEKNKSTILSLYPLKYQSFAALLMIEPDYNPYRNIVLKKITFMKNTDSKALLLLLSHFPLWID